MSEQVRVTYAQKKLQDLLQERKLKSWCEERNVPHATLYKLATGNIVPSFIVMSSLVPYFAPAEWVYFTDEDIPYEVRTLEVEKKYEISEINARNIFVNRRANITLLQMRKMAKDVNLEEFFILADGTIDGKFYPEQGDIVLHSGKKMLVLSRYDVNKKYSFFVGIDLVDETVDGIEVMGEKDSYIGLVQTVSSYNYSRKYPVVVDKINSGNPFEEILVKFNQIF